MAETFRPYQSIGEMLRQPQFPEGVGLKESQRTMLVLSQALDRMANFELQKDQQRAKVEGAEFGVENAPTLADIKTANESNKDAFEAFDENTIFGSAAKNAALSVAENEVLVDATATMTALVLNAQANGTDPKLLVDQLDSTIIGYVDTLRPSAPALADKLNARLKLNAIGEIKTYTKAHSSGGINTVNTGALVGYINSVNKIGSSLNAMVSDDKTFNLETLKMERNTLLAKASSLGLKEGPLLTKIEEIDTAMKEWFISKFTTELYETLDPALNIDERYLMIQKIKKGTFKTDDPELNRLLKIMKQYEALPEKDKTGVAIPTFDELGSAALLDINELLNMENQIDQRFEFDASQKANEIEIAFKDIMLSTEPLSDDQKKQLRGYIAELKNIGRDQEAITLEENLNDVLNFPGHPPRSVPETFSALSELQRRNKLTYAEILSRKAKLSRDDFDAFNTAIETQLDEMMAEARLDIVAEIQLDPTLISTENATSGSQKIAIKQYYSLWNTLKKERRQALADGSDFNPIKRVQELIGEKIDDISEKARLEELSKGVKRAKNLVSEITQYNQDIENEWSDTLTTDNDEKFVQNVIDVLESIKKAESLDDIPVEYQSITIRTYMLKKDEKPFEDRIQSVIDKLQKGLP